MELRRIQYFVTLAQYLHFSQAADHLYISQSSLSYHIAELELELGVQPFVRNKRKVSLTKAGAELLPVAREILAKVDELILTADEQNKKDKDSMKIHICFDTSSQRFDLFGIDAAIVKMRALYPDAAIRCSQSSMEQILDGLTCGNFDVGFVTLRHGEKLPPQFNVLPIHIDILSMVSIFEISSGNLASAFDNSPLFLLEDDIRWGNTILSLFKGMGVSPQVKWENSFGSMLTRVTTGEGITVIPHSEFAAERQSRKSLKALDFHGDEAKIYSCALWREANSNPAILPLISHIRNENTDLIKEGSFF